MVSILLFSFLSLFCTTESITTQPKIVPVSPLNTVYAFDMHKVFMEQNWSTLVTSLLCTYHVKSISLLDLKNRHRVGEKHFELMEKKHPILKGISKHFEHFLLNQPFMVDTIEIIKNLKQKGYKVYVLSNCAQETYDKLQVKYPAVFNLFDGEYLPSKNNNYNAKPHSSFYREFKSYLAKKGHSSQQIVFVDDKQKNILAAEKENIIGLHFTGAKKLKTDIAKLEYGLTV